MNRENLNSWLALLSNLGVVVGLILLIFELQQTNTIAEWNAIQQRNTEVQEANQSMALSDHLPAIYVKLQNDGIRSLNEEQLIRFRSWETAKLFRLTNQLESIQIGVLPPDNLDTVINAAAWFNQNYWAPLGLTIQSEELRRLIENVPNPTRPNVI